MTRMRAEEDQQAAIKARLERWISSIARGIKNPSQFQELLDHIQKHATRDLDRYLQWDSDLKFWIASMRNLVDILEIYLSLKVTKQDQIDRLVDQYRRNPKHRTKEPDIC